MIFELVGKIEAKQHLTQAEASALMQELLGGRVEEAEIVSLLTALGDKGPTLEELVGFASVMRSKAREALEEAGVDVDALRGEAGLLDTCGTGGDGRGTFNVSTAAAIVAAAAGARVAKHGNRSISSRSAAPTCSRRWACGWTSRWNAFRNVWKRSDWCFFLPRAFIWR